MSNITGAEIQKMVGHWLHTFEGGYLGSDYGQSLKSLLQKAQSDNTAGADATLRKLRSDVPVLQALPTESVNLYGIPVFPDKMELVIEVAGQGIAVSTPTAI